MHAPTPPRLSCGTVIFNEHGELLLCHVTGHDHWDLPKGGANAGESALQAALRETWEETGLQLDGPALLDLGRHAMPPAQALHLFATLRPQLDLSRLSCASHFIERSSGRLLPEMDGYRWHPPAELSRHCLPALASVLTQAVDLGRTWRTLADAHCALVPA